MRQPLDKRPAMTACLTISPEVRGSRPITIVRGPTYVPKACANRVSKVGVSESPTTPRTPEMLILRLGIGRMSSLIQSVAHPGEQTAGIRLIFSFDNNANQGFSVGSSDMAPARR